MEQGEPVAVEELLEDMRARGLLPGFFSGWGPREWRGVFALVFSVAAVGAFHLVALRLTGLPLWALGACLAIASLLPLGWTYSYLRWCQRLRAHEALQEDLLQVLGELPPASGSGARSPGESA